MSPVFFALAMLIGGGVDVCFEVVLEVVMVVM